MVVNATVSAHESRESPGSTEEELLMSTTTTAAGVRTVDGVEVPVPGTYVFDDAHTSIEFVGKHMMISKVRGRFEDFTGQIVIDEDPSRSGAEVEIKAGSLSTRNEQRDGHLKSPDFLDVEAYPAITFSSSRLEHVGENRWKALGQLKVRDITKDLALDVEFGGAARSPFGQSVAFFSGSVELDREEFGMTWNQALEAGGWLVGKKVRIEIETEAILQEEGQTA
jgi:polyisoprenoid-binding protein YceI